MTIYPKQTAAVVAWKKDWNGTWTNAPDMEVQSIRRCVGSAGDDTAVLLYRYGLFVDANGVTLKTPITQIFANSYVKIEQGGTILFIGVVVEGEDHSGATMSHNGASVLTGNQIFRLVGASEILRRRAVWQSLWLPESQASHRENELELGADPFKIDWIPPYNGECRNYITDVQPNDSFQTYKSYNSNMAVNVPNNAIKAGFGGAQTLTLEQTILYFSKLLETNEPKLPTFTIHWSSDCDNTKKQPPVGLDNPVVDNAFDVFRKLINPQASGLDFYFRYAEDSIYVEIFPAFVAGVDNNTNTSTLNLEDPLIEDFPVIQNSFRKYVKYRFIGERITFVDLLQGAYFTTDYNTNVVPLRPCTTLFGFRADNGDYLGHNKFCIGDPFLFNWAKFQPTITVNAAGQYAITNNAFPKQTLYLRTLDWVVDKFGKRHPGPIVTISGAEFLRRNQGGKYVYSDIDDDNVSENATYQCVALEDVGLRAVPLPDTIGAAIVDGEYRRLYGGRDSGQHGHYEDVTVDITDIKETVSDIKNVPDLVMNYCYPDLCYDTMTVTLAWESDQRLQVVMGDANAVDEQVVHVPGARLVIVRGYKEAGTWADPSDDPNVGENDNPVGVFQGFEKIAQTFNNIASAAQNQRWGVSCSVRDILTPSLLGSVIQLQRSGVQTSTDCLVKSLEYAFPADSSAVTRVNQ